MFNFTQHKTKLERALYYFLATNMASSEEKANLTRTFKAMDTNGDGTLTKEEIKVGFKKVSSITDAELNLVLQQVDSNTNANIDYTEFMVAALDRKKLLTSDKIESCFRLFDKVRIISL